MPPISPDRASSLGLVLLGEVPVRVLTQRWRVSSPEAAKVSEAGSGGEGRQGGEEDGTSRQREVPGLVRRLANVRVL